MKQTMKKALDNLNRCFDININAEMKKSLKHMLKDKDLEAKIETDDIELELDEFRGTRRPGNRAERRKATAHAKNSRRELASYADDPWYGIEFNAKTGKVKRWAGFAVETKVKNRKTRYDGKRLHEPEVDPFEKFDDINFEAEWIDVVDDIEWFDHYDRENCRSKDVYDYISWNVRNKIGWNDSFIKASVILRISREIDEMEAEKQRLLEEYADKIEELNKKLRMKQRVLDVYK